MEKENKLPLQTSGGEKRFLLFFIRRLVPCAIPMVEWGEYKMARSAFGML